MAFSFPYPVLGKTSRKIGEGCLSCVHSPYCPAVYWYKRYTFKELDSAMGRACLSWSADTSEKVKNPTEDDLDEEDYMFIHGIGAEANQNGIGGETTGGSRQSEGS